MDGFTADFLIDTATNFPFLGWMIYQYHAQSKINAEQRTEMKEIRSASKKEEKEIRARYDKVIKDIQEDRDQLVQDLSKKQDSLERSIRKIFAILDPIKQQIQEMQIKEKIKKEIATNGH